MALSKPAREAEQDACDGETTRLDYRRAACCEALQVQLLVVALAKLHEFNAAP